MNDPQTLIGLVEHYSPSGQERAAAEWLVDRMKILGFARSFVDEAGNAVGLMGAGSKQVVLLGHIDTVTGEIPVRVEDGILYGRGAVDAKGALACFVDAASGAGATGDWQLIVVGAVEEERDSEGARYAASAYHPRFAIIGEPNRWERVALGYKGSARANLTVRRERAHPAGQQPSACEAAVSLWLNIHQWAEDFNHKRAGTFDRLLLTLRSMQSGSDGFEEWARLKVDARLPLDLQPNGWYEHLRELADGVQVEPQGFAVPAYRCEKNTPLVRAFLAGIRAAGGTPNFVYKTGTADLNIVAPAWNCPSLVYGPGDSTLDHTPNEHISLDEYGKSVNALKKALETLMSL